VRYVPDPIRDERLNVGVVLIVDGAVHARLLKPSQASRLKRIRGGGDFRFLGTIEREINRAVGGGQLQLGSKSPDWNQAAVERAVREWAGTIQFSEIRGGVTDTEVELLDSLFDRYVVVPRQVPVRSDRHTLRSRVGRSLRRILAETHPRRDPTKWVKRDHYVRGKVEEHQFDYVVGNGKPIHLVQTFSFDVSTREMLRTELDAAAWAITDLRRLIRVPVSVVTVGDRQRELTEIARSVFPSVGADFVGGSEYDAWEARIAKRLASARADAKRR